MSLNLYEIAQQYRIIADRIESYEEVPEELEKQLAAVECSLDTKFDGYCAMRREFQAQAEAAKAEAKRLTALAEVRQHAADRIWRALTTELEGLGMQGYRTSRFTSYVQKNQPSCTVLDPESLPENYQRVTVEADKKALIQRWKDGEPLPLGVEVTQSTSWRLK